MRKRAFECAHAQERLGVTAVTSKLAIAAQHKQGKRELEEQEKSNQSREVINVVQKKGGAGFRVQGAGV
jgi:hypothetical protein